MARKNFPRNGTLLERLLYTSRVDPATGCRIWTGDTCKGYGRFTFRTKFKLAHRASYEVHKGPIPKGMLVCHACDTPACIEPEHLFLGTHKDNMRDMALKGRTGRPPRGTIPRGEGHPCARLNEDIVRQIRAGGRGWAKKLGVSEEAIRRVRRRLTWNHVE